MTQIYLVLLEEDEIPTGQGHRRGGVSAWGTLIFGNGKFRTKRNKTNLKICPNQRDVISSYALLGLDGTVRSFWPKNAGIKWESLQRILLDLAFPGPGSLFC